MLSLLAASGAAEPIYWENLGLRPYLFEVGGFQLRFYSLAYLLGILFAYWHLSKMIKAPGAPMAQRHADDLFFYCTLGVILGGRMADFLLERRPDGRVWVILFGLIMPVPAMWLAYTTDDVVLFYIGAFLAQMLSAAALGAAAASSQALVLPRMRGMATATFFLSTTLIGLGLGPFMAGYVSATNGDDLSLGVLSTLVAAPFGLVLLIAALKLVPEAAASVVERARAAGETI